MLNDRHMCSDELRAVRFVMKSIDPQAKVTARFIRTVQDFAGALTGWRAIHGDATHYRQTLQAIIARFPQVSEYLGALEKSGIGLSNDSMPKLEHEHIHVHEESDADKGRAPESYPLMKVANKKWQRGRG